jgi:hypothetical protein
MPSPSTKTSGGRLVMVSSASVSFYYFIFFWFARSDFMPFMRDEKMDLRVELSGGFGDR